MIAKHNNIRESQPVVSVVAGDVTILYSLPGFFVPENTFNAWATQQESVGRVSAYAINIAPSFTRTAPISVPTLSPLCYTPCENTPKFAYRAESHVVAKSCPVQEV